MAKTLRMTVLPTTRTDLLCIVCGHFLSKVLGGQRVALVPLGVEHDSFAIAGAHKGCLRAIRPRRPRKAPQVEEGAGA